MPGFMDFRALGNPYLLDLDIPKYLKKDKKIWKRFKTYYVYKSQNMGNRTIRTVGPDLEKTGTEQMMNILSITF